MHDDDGTMQMQRAGRGVRPHCATYGTGQGTQHYRPGAFLRARARAGRWPCP
jgi:hypothetical protein